MATSLRKMDCGYEDDGGATAGLNVNNNSNSNSFSFKSSESLLETNNNEQCSITQESDVHKLCNGNVEDKQTEKNLPGEISLSTITNQLNGDVAIEDKPTEKNSYCEISCTTTNTTNKDLAVGKDESECKSSPEVKLQSSMSEELSSAEKETLVENGSSTNQLDKCTTFVFDSEKHDVTHRDISDNSSTSEQTVGCIEKPKNVSEEGKQNSNSNVDLENCSANVSESAADSNLQNNLDTLKESIPVKSDVPKTCINTKSNDEILKNEPRLSCSDILEVLDESISEEEVYLEVDDVDEDDSDLSVEKQEAESEKTIDLKSDSICNGVTDNLKADDLGNGNDVSMNSDIIVKKSFDGSISEIEMCEEVDSRSEKESIDLAISNEKQDEPFEEKSSEIVSPIDLGCERLQIEFKSEASTSVNEQVESEMKENLCKNEIAVSEISVNSSELKSLELKPDVADEGNSSLNSTDMETSEIVKIVESSSITEGNSTTNVTEMETNEIVKSVELNIETEENSSTNVTDMEISEDAKTLESNIETEKNSSRNVTDMEISEDAKTLESNVTEGNSSRNVTDMEISEDAKTLESNVVTEGNSSKSVAGMATTENVETNIATEGNCLKIASDKETIEEAKTLESDIALEGKSSKSATDMDTSESSKPVDLNIDVEGHSSKDAADMETSENAVTGESNIAAEGDSSKNVQDNETSENIKTVESNIAADRDSSKNVQDNETSENIKTGDSSKNVQDNETSENIKTVESNIAAEGDSSKNVQDNETSDNIKTVESNVASEGNCLKIATDMVTIENSKALELDIAVEEDSSKNDTNIKTSESIKAVQSDIAIEGESSKNVSDIETSENAKSIESNRAAEGNSSKNVKDKETREKTINLDDFVVLSDIEWSDDDDDTSDKHKTKVETQNVEKGESVQNEKKCSKEEENQKDTLNENPGASSDGDDFDLDDVIEEFAKEENKVTKLSDDELDDLVEEFVEAEMSSPPVEKNELKSKDLPSESDDEMEMLIEDFKAVDSDNDCFIVQDSDNVVTIKDDDKDSQPKNKKSKLDDSQSFSGNSSDNVKSDAISSSLNLSKKPEAEAVAQKNKVEVVNTVTDTEKNKTVEIGFFKSEIFDSEVQEQKQNNATVALEISNKGDSEGTKNMGDISIVSAEPLSERLSGKRVNLECRTDGVYLRKDQSTDCNDTSSHSANENDDKLSVDQSVTNNKKSDSLEEVQCMDDMLNEVCLSSSSNSTNNEECKSTANEKESKKEDTSIQSEEKQMASLNGDVKSLGSICHDTLKDSKKRKQEFFENSLDEPQKKIKTDLNGVEDDIDTAQPSISRFDNSVRAKVLQHFKEAFPANVQLKKSWLEKLSKRLCEETILVEYKQKIDQQNTLIKNLEDKLQALDDELSYSQSQATTFLSIQQELFQKHHFAPQTAVRTVAVNVKIFRECDVPQPIPLPVVPKVEAPTLTTEVHGSTPVSSTPSIKVQVPQQKIPIPVPQVPQQKIPIPTPQAAVPQTVASARFVSNPMQPRAITTTSQRLVTAAPNVTMMKKEGPGISNSQPYQPRSYLAQKSQPQPKASNQVIDLTDEESNKKLLPASSTLVSIASNSVSNVNLPGLQNNPNVLLPLNGVFINNSQFPLSNPVQVQQVSRQAFVPTLQPNLLGPRSFAYIIPSNSGQISTIGRNSLPVSNFVPGPNQRLQTLIVRVTNPGQVPSMGSVINTNARMPMITQGIRTQTIRNTTIPSSSELVLLPRQPKHPAPFPPLQNYEPCSQLKAMPPKPSLKGSKAPSGIILSWNMSLLSLHAEISNYQLFAYQEAPGPVNSSLWKKVGDVKALPLPMACTLTQFVDGNKYYFTVRAVDVHNRCGPYSDAVGILFSDIKDGSKPK